MLIAQRLRQVRQARGLSLEKLAETMGGIISKQALSKYEKGKAQPSPEVLTRLAAALGVKVAYLCSQSSVRIVMVAYRKRAKLSKRQQEHLESLVRQHLEDRIWLQEQIGFTEKANLPVQSMPVRCPEDTEQRALNLRKMWNLGLDPIPNLVGVLEDRLVHVIQIDAEEDFDGMSAVAYRGRCLAGAAVVTRRNLPGERQRLNIAHELGHLVLQPGAGIDEEKAAFRFGAAFLAPAPTLRRAVGEHRRYISKEELLLLKKCFGISIQALLYRLQQLQIISQSYYQKWCKYINSLQWKRQEPEQMPPECPTWLQRAVFRALAEELISPETGHRLLGLPLPGQEPVSLSQRRAFLNLPLEQRREVLAKQAEKLAPYYQAHPDWQNWQGGDFLDYFPCPTQTR